jgi:5-(carboxyamino)imidazole ribonucleotide synthase
MPIRIKAPIGGYDGRSQLRIAEVADVDDAWTRLGQPEGTMLLAERELAFTAELSVVVARGADGRVVPYPVARNVHDAGILVESVAPAPVSDEVAARAVAIASDLATAMDLCGTLTAELFLLDDGALVVNELAPRVHNSGHWTIEGAVTSQFEQHIRAICGLPLGSPAASGVAAMVNILGTGQARPAHPSGIEVALADPRAHLHLYDKRRVFERRKMGHVTVVSDSAEDALKRARTAAAAIGWLEQDGMTAAAGVGHDGRGAPA